MAVKQMPEKLIGDNSDKSRGEKVGELAKSVAKDSVRAITKGSMRKRNVAMRLMDIFFEGSLKDAKDYVINDVAIPQVKNAVLKAIEVMFYGGASGSTYGGSVSRPTANTPYNSYFVGRDGIRRDYQKRPTDPQDVEKVKKNFDPRLIVVEDRGQAEMVLNDLKGDLLEYGSVSVQRLFNLVDIESDWASTGYGWKLGDLDNAKVRGCQGGYCFDLPEPKPID